MEIYRRMTPEQRMKIALDMSDEMRRISLNGIRARHPEMSEQEALEELIWLMHGVRRKPRTSKD
jgi:hypothetical protein